MTTALKDSAPRRFSFDTVFDGDRVIKPERPWRISTPEQAEVFRASAHAQGEASAVARAEADVAAALADIAASVREAMATLTALVNEHRTGAAELAMVAARRIADSALDHAPEAPATAALEALAREIDAAPRLIVRAAADPDGRLEKALAATADRVGLTGQIVLKTDAGMGPAAFVLDWGEGRAAYDPAAAAGRVETAVRAAVAAEGLHAEPVLTPAPAAEALP